MKRNAILALMSLLLLIFAVNASAGLFDAFKATADCDGWTATGNIAIAKEGDIEYWVTLTQDQTVVAEFHGTEHFDGTYLPFSFGTPWGVKLCGSYTASGRFELTAPEGCDKVDECTRTFKIPLDCKCPGEGCSFTPGYWKNHPDAWPVQSLEVGGVTYNMNELMAILDAPVRGDMTVILAHHLIAAKLNVLAEGDGGIGGVIDDADAYLSVFPLYSRPTRSDKDDGEDLKNDLAAYNELGCPDDDELSAPKTGIERQTRSPEPETTTWGKIKSLYQ